MGNFNDFFQGSQPFQGRFLPWGGCQAGRGSTPSSTSSRQGTSHVHTHTYTRARESLSASREIVGRRRKKSRHALTLHCVSSAEFKTLLTSGRALALRHQSPNATRARPPKDPSPNFPTAQSVVEKPRRREPVRTSDPSRTGSRAREGKRLSRERARERVASFKVHRAEGAPQCKERNESSHRKEKNPR